MAERETAQQRMDRLVQQQAGMNFGMQDDTFFGMMHNLKRSGAISNEEMMKLSDEYGELGQLGVQGAGAAAIGGAADLTAFATTIAYNAYNMARGGTWNWPENMRDVPATSDWWGKQMGLTKEQTDSLAFIGAGLVIAPTKLDGADARFMSNALRFAKALGGSKKAAVARRAQAEAMYKLGKSDTEIWKETGWWPDVDDTGKVSMRFFISDADATLEEATIFAKADEYATGAKEGERVSVFLRTDDVLKHDALYELYPEIGGYPIMVEVERTKDGWKLPTVESGTPQASFRAAQDPSRRRFKLYGESDSADARQSILHEIQHAVQTIDEITNGASATGMLTHLGNYEIASFMRKLHENPAKYQDLTTEQLATFFNGVQQADPSLSSALISQAKRALSGKADETDLARWATYEDKYWNSTRRWLSVMLTRSTDDEIKKMIATLPPERFDFLAHSRYELDLGEMEARLVQRMADLDQATIDALDRTPHQAMDPFSAGKDKRSEAFAPGVSYSKTSDQRLDLFIKPEYSLGEKVHVPMLKNPGPTELERFLGDTGIGSEQLRWMVNEGDLYVWEASAALHDDAAKALELPTIEGFTPEINFNKTGAGDISPKELLNVLWERTK